MSHVHPFLIIGIDAFGDVGICSCGTGEHEERERLAEAKANYPQSPWIASVMLGGDEDLARFREMQAMGAGQNDR